MRSLRAQARAAAAYAGLSLAERLASLLPARAAERLGGAMGQVAHRPLAVRRRTVESQIAAAFPDRPPSWAREVARACYRHFGREAALTLRASRAGRALLPGRVAGGEEALATFRRHVSPGSGSLVVTGHLGNWELAGAFLAVAGLPVVAVVRRQEPGFERRLAELRRRLGVASIPMEEATRALPRALDAGKTVALVADQHAGDRGVAVPFLGRPASTFRGPARLSLCLGAPLLFGALVREGEGYRAVLEPVATPEPGPEAEGELTRRWVACLEEAVRRWPEQYLWLHRRWKGTGTPAAGRR